MVKVYIASDFSLKDRILELVKLLESQGHEITRKWWERDFKTTLGDCSDDEWYQKPEVKQVCDDCFRGIADADIIILVAPESQAMKYNGASIELGYAMAKGIPILALGQIERSAMYYYVNKYNDLADVVLVADTYVFAKESSKSRANPFEKRWMHLENMSLSHRDPTIRQWLRTVLPTIRSIYPVEK